MSGINSGRWNRTMLNLCGIVVAILKMATDRKFFRFQEPIRDIIIYPHMKWRWNRTMLNLCGIVVAILKMATGRKYSMSGINSGHHSQELLDRISWNLVELSSKFDMWVDNDVPNWFPTLTNFYRLPFSKWSPQYRSNSTLSDFNDKFVRYCGDHFENGDW
jgi:hypothetical protein